MKISYQLRQGFDDDDLTFARQIGVDYVSVGTTGGTYEEFAAIKARVENAGLSVANIGNTDVHNMPEVTLNLPGRDAKIAAYKDYLRALGRLGLDYTTYAHMGNGIWSSAPATTRGDAPARHFDLATARGRWAQAEFVSPLSHGRRYTEDELWDNYAHFIRQVAPVAEQEGVRIGMHPDDPPALELAGVPRCVLGTYDGYARALEIADSPNVGVCLCMGTWLEGGDLMGRSVADAARAFAGLGKLWKIHFRNVSAPLPVFTETFVDNGYADMRALMRTLVDLDFDGILIADHVPAMVGDRRTGWAYSLGYIKALRDMAADA
ncbi:MAG TPA: mannonate dehydratase [Actinopolymorphaceae bacterium]|nr:mannonate dehydratase [Actinopolymorphaceae bacterium]